MATAILLSFHGETPQLTQTVFSRSGQDAKLCIRGKTAGSYHNAGTFQWTSAVQGLCVLLIKAHVSHLDPSAGPASISGLKDSLASSLDYALVKQPLWLTDMFGVDAIGNTYARRLITKSNSQRKLPGPVTLSINDKSLLPSDIRIVWNDTEIASKDELKQLISLIDKNESANESDGVAGTVSKALAA
jgi:hypothetical protein